MSCRIVLLLIGLCLILSACAPEVQAQNPAIAQPSHTDSIPLTTTESSVETAQALATQKPDPEPSPTQVPVKAGTFEKSVLVAEWNDGKRQNRLYPLDPESGKAIPGYPAIALGENFAHAFSPDRGRLAIATLGRLMLVDLKTWTVREFDLEMSRIFTRLVYDPDGRRLAIASGDLESTVAIFDLEDEKITAQGSLEILFPSFKFTSDGLGLMVYGTAIKYRFSVNEMAAGPPQVLLLDSSDLSTRWSAELDGVRDGTFPKDLDASKTVDLSQPDSAIYLYPGKAFAPDRNALYLVHADEDKLTTVDYSAQSVETAEIRMSMTWFERLLALTAGVARAKVAEGTSKQAVASPDGTLLYVLGVENTLVQEEGGKWQIDSKPLGLHVIRTSDASRLASYETEASEIAISPDGRFLYLSRWSDLGEWTEVFDTSQQKVVDRVDGILMPVFRMNGEILLEASDYTDGTRTYITIFR